MLYLAGQKINRDKEIVFPFAPSGASWLSPLFAIRGLKIFQNSLLRSPNASVNLTPLSVLTYLPRVAGFAGHTPSNEPRLCQRLGQYRVRCLDELLEHRQQLQQIQKDFSA